MKKITTLVLSCTILLLTACDNKETKNTNEGTSAVSKDSTVNETVPSDESADGNGTYTAEGRTYTGKVTTATDGLKFFTVTCEGDMVQQIAFDFKTEEAARKGGSFNQGSLTPIENNEVGIMFGIGYKSKETLGGTITVSGSGGKNVIEFKDVKLTVPDKSMVVSGKIPF
jgi:major membrane immunogen (membrane-anchored lipoprotein)